MIKHRIAVSVLALSLACAALPAQAQLFGPSDEEKALWADIQKARVTYLSSRDQAVKAKAEGQLEEAERLLTQVVQLLVRDAADVLGPAGWRGGGGARNKQCAGQHAAQQGLGFHRCVPLKLRPL